MKLFLKILCILQFTGIYLKAEDRQVSICFYPEGSRLIQGLKTWVAFEVKGISQDIPFCWGAVYNNQNERVVLFAADSNGRGEFCLIPDKHIYYAELHCGDRIYRADLPVVEKSGYTLEIDNVTGAEDLKYGRVYTAEQLERVKRYIASWGGHYFPYDDIEKTGEKSGVLVYLQRWSWKEEPGSLFQGKYLPTFPDATEEVTEYSYWLADEDDIKVRISRTEDMPIDTLILTVWKDGIEIDRQPVCMRTKDAYLRFLLRNLPEGDVKFTLAANNRQIAERWVNIVHYQRGRSYTEAKTRDIGMLCRSIGKEISMNAKPHMTNCNINVIVRPEGGNMLADARSILAFRAHDDKDHPLNIYGVIRNSMGQVVGSLETYGEGMGDFDLLPDGKPYQIYYSNGVVNGMAQLQTAPDTGYTIEVDCISQIDDGKYGDEYTIDQKKQITRLLSWYGAKFNVRDRQVPLWPIQKIVKEYKVYDYPLSACNAVRITLRKRVKEQIPLFLTVYKDDRLLKRVRIEQPAKLQKIKTWIPVQELEPGQMTVYLENENGNKLAGRRICLLQRPDNYRQAKIEDLRMIIE